MSQEYGVRRGCAINQGTHSRIRPTLALPRLEVFEQYASLMPSIMAISDKSVGAFAVILPADNPITPHSHKHASLGAGFLAGTRTTHRHRAGRKKLQWRLP